MHDNIEVSLFRRILVSGVLKWIAFLSFIPILIFLLNETKVNLISGIIVTIWLVFASYAIIFEREKNSIICGTRLSNIILCNLDKSHIEWVISYMITRVIGKKLILVIDEPVLIDNIGFYGTFLLIFGLFTALFILSFYISVKLLDIISEYYRDKMKN